MRGWLVTLAAWCRLPMRGGFAELDRQIDKLRILRDSYQAAPYKLRPDYVSGESMDSAAGLPDGNYLLNTGSST